VAVTVVPRRRAEVPRDLVEGPATVTREELAAAYGADPADVALLRAVLTEAGLVVGAVDIASRRAEVSGSAGAVAEVFGARLSRATSADPRR